MNSDIPLQTEDIFFKRTFIKKKKKKIVASHRGMHVSPAKHSYAWLPRKCDYHTHRRMDRQTDRLTDGLTDPGQSDHCVTLCFASDTTGYWLDVCHGWFHLHGLPRAARSGSESYKMKNSCPQRDSNSQPLDFKAATVTVRPWDLILNRQVRT